MSWLEQVIGYGTHAARPAAGSAGRLYYETDTDTLLRDNGGTWDALALAGGGGASAPLVLVGPSPSTVPLVVRGAASQTADLQQWQDSTGAVLARIDSFGDLSTNAGLTASGNVVCNRINTFGNDTNNIGGTLIAGVVLAIHSVGAATIPLVTKGVAGQSSDLQQWQDSTGAVLAKVDQGGGITPTAGARITSGAGAPTTPGGANPTAGDFYFRTDAPSTATERLYVCTVGGATPTWVGVV